MDANDTLIIDLMQAHGCTDPEAFNHVRTAISNDYLDNVLDSGSRSMLEDKPEGKV